jgi:hypothetical protein
MKKLITLVLLIFVALISYSQERTVNNSKTTFENGITYLGYVGVAADTLKETNQDTIDFVFNNYNHYAVEKISLLIKADSLAGNDSIYYKLTGYEFPLSATGTLLASGGALINTTGELIPIVIEESDSISFRKYVLRLTQDSNNDYDGGAIIKSIFNKLFLK